MNKIVTYYPYPNSYIVEDDTSAIEVYDEDLDESLRNDPKFISAFKRPSFSRRNYLKSKAKEWQNND